MGRYQGDCGREESDNDVQRYAKMAVQWAEGGGTDGNKVSLVRKDSYGVVSCNFSNLEAVGGRVSEMSFTFTITRLWEPCGL